MILEKRRRHVARYREIGAVLADYGWSQFIARLGLTDILKTKRSRRVAPSPPEGLKEALEALGPTFVKFGQILSTRADLVPEQYIRELQKLQDTASIVPTSEVCALIEEELGRPVDEIYHAFEAKPLAAASLGQVHAALLHTGEEVIVKVQRPNILETIDTDIEIMHGLAAFLERRWETAKIYGLVDIVDEYSITIHEELDYTREARNTDRLRENLESVDDVRAPRVHWELTTPRVLTIERIRGDKINEVSALREKGIDLKELARRLVSAFLQQIFIDGFFHADPHPGNILVMPDGKVALVDCGQASRFDAVTKSGLIRLLTAFEQQNARKFADEMLSLGIAAAPIDTRQFSHDVAKLLRRYYDTPSRSVDLGRLLVRVLNISARYSIRFPSQFAVLAKVLSQLDDNAKRLDPDFLFTETAKPYIIRAVRTELTAEGLLTEAIQAITDAKELAFTLPERANELMRRMVEGTLRTETHLQGTEDLTRKIDKLANRLSFALICAGLVVASSIIVASGQGGKTSILGLPTLGLIGYLIAAFFGMWLLISIIRGGRL